MALTDEQIRKLYKHRPQKEHLHTNASMYIGAIEKTDYLAWTFADDEDKFQLTNIRYSAGLLHTLSEIMMNALDQSRRTKVEHIDVSIGANGVLSVYNSGEGFHVQVHPESTTGQYIPEYFCTEYGTSTNFGVDKTGAGVNGVGIKAVVGNSMWFSIETIDPHNKKKYSQTFEDHMKIIHPPKIETVGKGSPSYTRFTWMPDYKHFGYTSGIDQTMINLMEKRVYDLIAGKMPETKITLNGETLLANTFNELIRMYVPDNAPIGCLEIGPWKIGIGQDCWDQDKFVSVSFVNGIFTQHGGTHVNYIIEQVQDKLYEYYKTNKDFKNTTQKVLKNRIKANLSLFVSLQMKNPQLNNQTKDQLATDIAPELQIQIPDKWLISLANTLKLEVLLKSDIKSKVSKELKKADGKKKIYVNVEKLEDANKAGSAESEKCTLYIVEGDSAKGGLMAARGVSAYFDANYTGMWPLRGKILNVHGKNDEKIYTNQVIMVFMQILGLKRDEDYSGPKGKKKLRYGQVCIVTDADTDGSHIKGLVLNLFLLWPSLIERGDFLSAIQMPILSVTLRQEKKWFYTIADFEKQKLTTVKPEYYKGLATYDKEDMVELMKKPRFNPFIWDTGAGESLDQMFNPKRADDRKVIIREATTRLNAADDMATSAKIGTDGTITSFMRDDFILFSLEDCHRSLPAMADGLKPSQRKIVWALLNNKKLHKKKMIVDDITSYIKQKYTYHHGVVSLQQTLIKMAQCFKFTNQIALVTPIGNFGAPLLGPEEAGAPRYISAKMSAITKALFPAADFPIHNLLVEDGREIEPDMLMPILPIALINGVTGIGTGFSCDIPCFNPEDVLANVRNKILGRPFQPMRPWYRFFKGHIVDDPAKAGSWITYGCVKVEDEGKKITVTELPFETWTTPWLDERKKDFAEIIENIDTFNTDTILRIIFYFTEPIAKDADELLKKLKLKVNISTNNMYLFDAAGVIKYYPNVETLLDDFMLYRGDCYTERKDYLVKKISLDILMAQEKVRFIKSVNAGKLILSGRKKVEIAFDLRKMKFTEFSAAPVGKSDPAEDDDPEDPEDQEEGEADDSPIKNYGYLFNMAIHSFTAETINKLENQIKLLTEEKRKLVEEITPTKMWLDDLDIFEKEYKRAVSKLNDKTQIWPQD